MTIQQIKFKDLNEISKQKLIELHRKSTINSIENTKKHKIESFDDVITKIDTYQSDKIKKNLTRIAEYLESTKNVQEISDVEDNLISILNDLQNKIESYNLACKEEAFLEELKKTYMMLSGRFLEIRNKYK